MAVASATHAEALRSAADALAAAGVESSRLDAELLLAAATGRDRAALLARGADPVPESASTAFAAMVRRRLRREPLAYIVGHKAFRSIELAVDRRVLIPRPETELLVEVASELGPKTVLDVGTGSGAVALAVADEILDAEVVGTDVSPDALAVAAANAARLGLERRVRFELGTLPPEGRPFDLLLANLPYVRADEWSALAPEIRDHEPRGALVAGGDGLAAIRSLLAALLAAEDRDGGRQPCAAIALEIGAGQAGAVARLVGEAGFERIEVRPDLAGIGRVVLAHRGRRRR